MPDTRTKECECYVLALNIEHYSDVPSLVLVERTTKQLQSSGWRAGEILHRVTPLSPHLALQASPPSGSLGAKYTVYEADPAASHVTITDGNVQLPSTLRGCGLGSFLMNENVLWLHEERARGRVTSISLAKVDATTAQARDRRNRWYEKFGVRFDWFKDPDALDRAIGRSCDDLMFSEIRCDPSQQRVKREAFASLLRDLLTRLEVAERQARTQRTTLDNLTVELTRRSAVSHRRVAAFFRLIVLGALAGLVYYVLSQ